MSARTWIAGLAALAVVSGAIIMAGNRGPSVPAQPIAGNGQPKTPPKESAMPEHAVLVHFVDYGSSDLTALFALEDELATAIARAGVGEFDGDEIAVDGSDGTLYMYGPDADALFAVVQPILARCPFMKGAVATKQYGPPDPGVRTVEVPIQPE